MSERTCYIYALMDPRTDEIRYVGKTVDPAARLSGHISDARNYKNHNYYKESWIRELLKEKTKPEMRIIEKVSEFKWAEAEDAWVDYFQDKPNCNLTNIAGGGVGPGTHSEETKAILSRIAKERGEVFWSNLSEEEREQEIKKRSERISGENNPMFGKDWTEEEKEFLREEMENEWEEYRKKREKVNRNIGPKEDKKYKGIVRVKRKSGFRWQTFIGNNGKTRYIGTYKTPEEAALVYDLKALEVYKGECYLNILNRNGNIPDKYSDLELPNISKSNGQASRGPAGNNKYKGVTEVKRKTTPNKWTASIKNRHIGTFKTPEKAAKAYDKEAIKEYGKDCYTNILDVEKI